ncbi:hypothetical protein D3C84_837190 [compost metagenome]
MTLAFGLHTDTSDVDAIGFAVNVDDELGRHAFAARFCHTARFRNWQQHFRGEGAGGTLFEELAADVREHGKGQHVFFRLG